MHIDLAISSRSFVHYFEMVEIVLKNVEARGAIGSGKSFGIF